jgi:hypothetical protein
MPSVIKQPAAGVDMTGAVIGRVARSLAREPLIHLLAIGGVLLGAPPATTVGGYLMKNIEPGPQGHPTDADFAEVKFMADRSRTGGKT